MLTKEEKYSVVRMVLESNQNTTISEAKTNTNLQAEMILNLEFYSGLKKHLASERQIKEGATGISWIDNVLTVIGSVKDLLTSTDIGKWLSEKEKLFPSFTKTQNDWTDKLKRAVDKFAKWLGPKAVAYILAAWKKRTLKPGEEAIQAEMPRAAKIYKILLIILIIVGIIKLVIFLHPFIAAGTAAASSASASMSSVANAVGGVVQHAGLGGFTIAGFNILGVVNKISHLKPHDAHKELKAGLNTATDSLSQELH
jgi:hypothetical protein